jgi:L-rhamnose mutarotase
MDFPEWAPKILIDKYIKYNEEKLTNQEYLDLMFKLITDRRMARVWRMLLKKKKKCALKEYGVFVMPEQLLFAIAYALKEMKSEHLSRTEEFNNYNEIAKAAKHLSNLVKNTELDRYYRDAENIHDWFQDQVVSKKRAKLSNIIIGLEKDATKLVKRALTRKRFLQKPKSASEITIFIRVLYLTYWKDAFDEPMNGTFASLCNVVIEGTDIDDQKIRYALESYR